MLPIVNYKTRAILFLYFIFKILIAPGGWKLQENPDSERVKELIEGYKMIAARERLERDRKKYPLLKRRNFTLASTEASSSNTISSLNHSDKYGLLSPIQKKLNIKPEEPSEQRSIEEYFNSLVKPPKLVDSFERLSAEFYSTEININSSKKMSLDLLA